jgi:hypothetical protein
MVQTSLDWGRSRQDTHGARVSPTRGKQEPSPAEVLRLQSPGEVWQASVTPVVRAPSDAWVYSAWHLALWATVRAWLVLL